MATKIEEIKDGIMKFLRRSMVANHMHEKRIAKQWSVSRACKFPFTICFALIHFTLERQFFRARKHETSKDIQSCLLF